MLTTGVNLVSQTDEIKEGMPELKCSVENKASVDEKTEKLEQKVERKQHPRYVVCGRESVTTRQKNEAIAAMEKAKKTCAKLKDQLVLKEQMNECLTKTVKQQRMIIDENITTIRKNKAIAAMEKAKETCAKLKDQLALKDQMTECLTKTIEEQRTIQAKLRETAKGLRKDAKASKMIMGFIKYMKNNKRQRVAGGAKAAADDDEDFGMEDEEEEEEDDNQEEPNETSKDVEQKEEEEKESSDSDESV